MTLVKLLVRSIGPVSFVVLVATVWELAIIHHQVTKGKLPFNVRIFPNIGG